MVANAAKLMAEFQDFMLPAFFAPPLTKAQTPVAFVNAIVEAYKRRNIDPSSALEKSQIEPKILNNVSARITALQMEAVSGLAMRELDDEALGWFNRRLPWGSYGMLVRASLSAPTLGVAMQRWCRHHGLLTDTIAITLTENEGVAYLTIEERSDLGALREFCVVSVLRNALGVACWLSDSRISLRQTHLRFLAPAHHASYQVLFEGETVFDAETHCVTFDARYLDLPIRRDEAALQTMLQRALLLTVRPYRRDRLLVEKVRHALAHHPEHSRNAEDLAIHLNLSARTLHRQLKDEGASLQQLKDAVRRDVAVAQLQRSKRPIKQIAALAGFQNEKSFIRAFKTWTGQTPDAFRGRNASS
jgi:AraC-like DNA-binding protein